MTRPIRKVDVICPKCGHTFEDWHRVSVNLDLNDFYEGYLDECSSAVCPKCGFKIDFDSLKVKDGEFYLE